MDNTNPAHSKETLEEYKKVLKKIIEHKYVPQSNVCMSYQLAHQLKKSKKEELLSIDDTIGPQLNELAEQALTEIAEEETIFRNSFQITIEYHHYTKSFIPKYKREYTRMFPYKKIMESVN